MLKKIALSLLMASAMIVGHTNLAKALPEVYPVGTLQYQPEKSYGGYTLVDVFIEGNTYAKLVDLNGNEVHRWENTLGMPSKMMPNGNILTGRGEWKNGRQDRISSIQLDWDGNVVWEFKEYQGVNPIEGEAVKDGKSWVSRQHHDIQREGMGWYYTPGEKPVKDGKTLILSHINKYNKKIHPTARLIDDYGYIVDGKGKIIWDYSVSDHVDDWGFSEAAFKAMQGYGTSGGTKVTLEKALKTEGSGFDWFHANSAAWVGPNKWYDAGDQRFHPENIIINSRTSNVSGIIDHKTKKLVWRLGPDYSAGTPDDKIGQIVGPHAAHIIAKGLPGAGNFMIFDNGGLGGYGEPNINSPTGINNARRDYSRVIEFNPVTKEIVWEYNYLLTSTRLNRHYNHRFYSPFTSIAQRLPNGNTVITEGNGNRILEVTKDLEIVWEYMVPETVVDDEPLYRSYRVPYEYVPQLAKPEEVAVIPPAVLEFTLPNAKGEYPEIIAGGVSNLGKKVSDQKIKRSTDEDDVQGY